MAENRQRVSDTSLDGRESGLSPAARRLLWIVAYYLVAGVAVALLWRTVPAVRDVLESNRLREELGANTLSRSGAVAAVREAASSADWSPGLSTLLALTGALATALPVAWVYSLTRRRKGFTQSMVHTLILLPVAIAGMVVLIQNSLALAFSLAGIVALLRFRNTLDDAKDGVYIFVATAVGISGGVGVLIVGVATSVVFNIVVVMLWWIDFARQPTPGIRGGIRRLARLPRTLPTRARLAPPAAADDAWSPDETFAPAAQLWRQRLQESGSFHARNGAERPAPTLRVHTMDPATSQPLVERLLGEHARRWSLEGIMPGDGERVTLRYRVRLPKEARGSLLNAVRRQGSPQIVGVEFR
jgi:hypothetical protein